MTVRLIAKWLCAAVLLTVGVSGCGAQSPPPEPAPDQVKIGTAYEYQMHTHCGADEALFAGQYWEAVRADPQHEGSPFGWADPYQKGTMKRVSENSAAFEAKGHEKRHQLRPGATSFLQICD
ncbi:hypothetical protein O4215_20230 [Rhodococcus maanshanensis]|uniref:hypothetical protein n=1 Tax=Rhodococcus maanshanensis TaxID=183556 RepID=UPI0022B4E816|nr:hypothetical protein [Rhodococcus maanshanensis]MCZ4557896.1 hypothetical protein [Rhodococcus maanshanensis]